MQLVGRLGARFDGGPTNNAQCPNGLYPAITGFRLSSSDAGLDRTGNLFGVDSVRLALVRRHTRR